MSRPDEYLAIPDAYGQWLGGLQWSADGEAVEHVADDPGHRPDVRDERRGRPVPGRPALGPIADRLRLRPPPAAPAGGGASPSRGGASFGLLGRLASAYRASGRPLRNAGALCGMLCRDVPRATDPPDIDDLDDHLRRGPAPTSGGELIAAWRSMSVACEIPSLEPEEFQDRVRKALFALDDDALLHWLRLGRGPIGDVGEEVAREADASRPPSLLEVLDAVGRRPRLAGAASLVAHLDGALVLPSRRLEASALPIGGYSDVTTRGQPEQILPSQFALDDLEFLRRFAARELLYYHREDPRAAADEELVLVIDQGVRTWGDVRLVLAAAALALARRSARRGLPLRIAATSSEAASGGDEDTLGRLMEASDLSPHPGPALERALEEPAGAALRDVVLLTHPRNLAEPEVSAAARRVAPGTRLFAVAVDESGGVELSEVRRGMRLLLSRCRVAIPEGAAVARESASVAEGAWRGDVEPIGFPFRLGAIHPIEDGAYDFDESGDWLLAACGKLGFFHAWRVDGSAMEMLPRPIIDGRPLCPVEAVLGVAGGFVVAGRRGDDLVAAHYDFAGRICTAHVIGPPPAPGTAQSRHDLLWLYDRARHALVVVNAKAPRAAARTVDLGADRSIACFRGIASEKSAQRAMIAAVHAGKLSSPRMLVVADGFPLPPDVDAIRLDRDSGKVGARAGGVWCQFTPLSDGGPELKAARILHARCAGGNLAVLVEDYAHRRTLQLFAMPDGRSLGCHRVGAKEDGFVLSRDGRRFARRVARCTLEVHDVGGGSLPRLATTRGRVHDRLILRLQVGCLVLEAGGHLHVAAWGDGPLRVIPSCPGSAVGHLLPEIDGQLIPATTAGDDRRPRSFHRVLLVRRDHGDGRRARTRGDPGRGPGPRRHLLRVPRPNRGLAARRHADRPTPTDRRASHDGGRG